MKFPGKRVALGFAVLAALVVPAHAEQSTPWEPLEQRLVGIRGQIRNLSARFKAEVVGGGVRSTSSDVPMTPGLRCCSLNLDRVNEHMAVVGEMLDRLATGFERPPSPNRTALTAITRMRASLEQLGLAIDAFGAAKDRDTATAVLGGLHRAFLDLRSSADGLVLCCPPPERTNWFDVGMNAPVDGPATTVALGANLRR